MLRIITVVKGYLKENFLKQNVKKCEVVLFDRQHRIVGGEWRGIHALEANIQKAR